MLFLQFYIAKQRYVIDAGNILTIIPLIQMHKVSAAPDYMAGVIQYKGQTVPVVDLSKLVSGTKSKPRLSTRIVLVDYATEDMRHNAMGFIAEKATEIVKWKASGFSPQNVASDSAPYLVPIAKDSKGKIQKIDIDRLIELKLRNYLDFQAA